MNTEKNNDFFIEEISIDQLDVSNDKSFSDSDNESDIDNNVDIRDTLIDNLVYTNNELDGCQIEMLDNGSDKQSETSEFSREDEDEDEVYNSLLERSSNIDIKHQDNQDNISENSICSEIKNSQNYNTKNDSIPSEELINNVNIIDKLEEHDDNKDTSNTLDNTITSPKQEANDNLLKESRDQSTNKTDKYPFLTKYLLENGFNNIDNYKFINYKSCCDWIEDCLQYGKKLDAIKNMIKLLLIDKRPNACGLDESGEVWIPKIGDITGILRSNGSFDKIIIMNTNEHNIMFYLLEEWFNMNGSIDKYPYDKACYFCFKLYEDEIDEIDEKIISLSTVLKKYK